MKLHLVLAALLQQSLCAQQAVDPAELHLALQSKHLDAWIESIAAKRQMSKDAVRSNVQAVTYYPDPVSKGPGSAGGEQPKLERRDIVDYPAVFSFEVHNDQVTNDRLFDYHDKCRNAFPNPLGTPHTPNHGVKSFWRATGGGCRDNIVRINCRLPNDFGPPNWVQGADQNIHETSSPCGPYHECVKFKARNFCANRAVNWGGCIERKETDKKEMVNNVPEYYDTYPCPMSPGTMRTWDMYAETFGTEYEIDWVLFTGLENEKIRFSRSKTLVFGSRVKWRGTDPDYQPWLKFERTGAPATISLYSHVI